MADILGQAIFVLSLISIVSAVPAWWGHRIQSYWVLSWLLVYTVSIALMLVLFAVGLWWGVSLVPPWANALLLIAGIVMMRLCARRVLRVVSALKARAQLVKGRTRV